MADRQAPVQPLVAYDNSDLVLVLADVPLQKALLGNSRVAPTMLKARTHWANFPSADSNNRPTPLQSRPILPPIL